MHVPPHSDPMTYRTFSPEEQEAILSLAMKMQHEAANERTLQELERTASEVGIDPHYIREAARRITPGANGTLALRPTGVDQIAIMRALGSAIIFIPAQLTFAKALITRAWIPQNVFLYGIGLAILIALTMPRGKQWRYATPALSIAGMLVSLTYLRFFLFYGTSFLFPITEVAFFVAFQSLLAVSLHSLADRAARTDSVRG